VVIGFHDERPAVSPEALAAAERRLGEVGRTIPPSYKAFLAERDGGKPARDCFAFDYGGIDQEDRIRFFLGIAPSPNGNLVDVTWSLSGRMPEGVLPIGEDPFGNFICLDGRDGRDGPVLFWDHEYEGEPPDEANLYEIAPDLQTFLDSLYEDPDPPVVPQQQTGWRRLFGRRR
jgi:hypothetical protein